jgi:hypothetical protein
MLSCGRRIVVLASWRGCVILWWLHLRVMSSSLCCGVLVVCDGVVVSCPCRVVGILSLSCHLLVAWCRPHGVLVVHMVVLPLLCCCIVVGLSDGGVSVGCRCLTLPHRPSWWPGCCPSSLFEWLDGCHGPGSSMGMPVTLVSRNKGETRLLTFVSKHK